MAEKNPGDRFIYEYQDKTYLATVRNTYEEGGDKYATLSLSGTDIIITTENDFD